MRCIAAQDSALTAFFGINLSENFFLQLFNLFITQQRNDAKGFSCILRLFHTRFQQSDNCFCFIGIRFSNSFAICHTVVDHSRQKNTVTTIPQRLDLEIIRKPVGKFNNFWNTSKMFMQHQRLEGCSRNVVNGCFRVIQMGIWNFIGNVHFLQNIHFINLNANSHRTDLFIITYNDQFFAHIQNGQRRDIRLACLIDNNDVKFVGTRVQTFQCFADRHDPCRDSLLALHHQFTSFCTVHRSIFSGALSDFLNGQFPSLQRLLHADIMFCFAQ